MAYSFSRKEVCVMESLILIALMFGLLYLFSRMLRILWEIIRKLLGR